MRGLVWHHVKPAPRSSVVSRSIIHYSRRDTSTRARRSCSSAEGVAGNSTGQPRAVIFDLGGVVVPSPFPMFARFERALGLPSGSVVKTISSTGARGAWARLERGELSVGEFGSPFSEELFAITGREVSPDTLGKFLEEFRVGRQVTVRPAVQEAIRRLRSCGIKTAVLTNNFRYDDGGTLLPQENLSVDVVSSSHIGSTSQISQVYIQYTKMHYTVFD